VIDVEPIYDEQISPLMERIITICKEHGIPMVATFQLNDIPDDYEGDNGDIGPTYCTTSLPPRVDGQAYAPNELNR